MATIQHVLQGMYKTSGKGIFLNEDAFIHQLVQNFEPNMKDDCRLLERAIRCGAGKIIIQFLQQGRQPSPEETVTFGDMLHSRANFTKQEAQRIIELLYEMVGFPYPRKGEGPSPWKEPPVKKIRKINLSSLMKLPSIHLLLSLGYVLFMVISFADIIGTINPSADPLSTLGGAFTSYMAGKLLGPNLFFMAFGLIFSIIGFFVKKGWPYLTAAIIQTIAVFMVLNAAGLIQPLVPLACVAIAIVGYVTFALVRKGKV